MHQSEKQVVLGNEDIKNIEEFFGHFNIVIPEQLKARIDIFKKSGGGYTVEQQTELKIELARAVINSDHELLKDEVFGRIMDNCDKEWFDAQFTRDIEEALSEED